MKSIAKNRQGFMKIRHSVFTERAVRKRKLTAGELVLIENLGHNNRKNTGDSDSTKMESRRPQNCLG
jgi:hypothetical protein